jgi:hypothetical protein
MAVGVSPEERDARGCGSLGVSHPFPGGKSARQPRACARLIGPPKLVIKRLITCREKVTDYLALLTMLEVFW